MGFKKYNTQSSARSKRTRLQFSAMNLMIRDSIIYQELLFLAYKEVTLPPLIHIF